MCGNGWTGQDAIWVVDSGGPREACIRWDLDPACLCREAVIRGKDMPRHARRHCHQLCKNGWTNWFAVWVVDSGGLKEGHVQSYLPVGSNVPSHEGTLMQPDEYDWTIRLWWRCACMSNYFDHLLLLLLGRIAYYVCRCGLLLPTE